MPDGDVLRRLQDLVDYPHEGLEIEVKPWLDLAAESDKANLAQAMIAIANHGGGYILIGFEETGGGWLPDSIRPASLDVYSQDRANGIIQRYAEPSFHCELHLANRSDSHLPFPVIIVPGGHSTPIRSRRDGPNGQHVTDNTYYIRRPGPSSEAPRTGEEWDRLIRKCVLTQREQIIDELRSVLVSGPTVPTQPREDENNLADTESSGLQRWSELTEEKFGRVEDSPYRYGFWLASYAIEGEFPDVTLATLLDALAGVRGQTGWPPWWVPTRTDLRPYMFDDGIECWLADGERDAGHSDFWRATLPPRLFLLRGYQEDSEIQGAAPGSLFDLTLPIWRVGEAMLHAARLAESLAAGDSAVRFQFTWQGLEGRRLESVANRHRDLGGEYVAKQNQLTSQVSSAADVIQDVLPELVQSAVSRLYEIFDFFQPPDEMYQQELARMRSRSI